MLNIDFEWIIQLLFWGLFEIEMYDVALSQEQIYNSYSKFVKGDDCPWRVLYIDFELFNYFFGGLFE